MCCHGTSNPPSSWAFGSYPNLFRLPRQDPDFHTAWLFYPVTIREDAGFAPSDLHDKMVSIYVRTPGGGISRWDAKASWSTKPRIRQKKSPRTATGAINGISAGHDDAEASLIAPA